MMNKKASIKVIFFGNREVSFFVFDEIISDNRFDVVAVVVHAEHFDIGTDYYRNKLISLAKERMIDVLTVSSKAELLDKVCTISCDVILSVGFMNIFPAKIISLPKIACINAHAGALPRYRGRYPLNWAIYNGEKEFGITVHGVDEGVDSGPILLQKLFPIREVDVAEDVYGKMVKNMPSVVHEALVDIWSGNYSPVAQKEGEAIYYPNVPDEVFRVNWFDCARDILNQIRAFSNVQSGVYCFCKNEKIYILQAQAVVSPVYRGVPGHVVDVGKGFCLVKTLDGLIDVKAIKIGGVEVPPCECLVRGEVLG